MNILYKFRYIIIFIYIILINISYVSAEKINNLVYIKGSKDIQLIGYGLVVGLNGTGDQTLQTPFTYQSLNNMLIKFGLHTKNSKSIQTRNTAAVIVTAIISPFDCIGKKIDITVSSIGNATSLTGGTLLMTPLKNIDKKICAIAQGNILIKKKIKNKENNPNRKKIINGAILEKSISNNIYKNNNGKIFLKLIKKNKKILKKILKKINYYYPNIAYLIDKKTIKLYLPKKKNLQEKILRNILNVSISMKNKKFNYIKKNNQKKIKIFGNIYFH
ncbi:flagellar basal body P-ring protein FlgI [Buchnera aphidicola]|uniref:Flagellar P-ring protein n=1 Tax=Buchnera aphidicola subsp. Cinara cedri (strain Cc) TaxID=372461 RepID=Q057L7_BUCCC|nr:flagellar basal body P-ring protein FlgI [Buchnera aphidicola]ABJ90682.1 flagellar P-ring protein precursor [Buchnera aphidicola BCc]